MLEQQVRHVNHNISLPDPTKRAITSTCCSSSSVLSCSKLPCIKSKQTQLPLLNNRRTTITTTTTTTRNNNRHTSDFSGKCLENKTGASQIHALKRTNSLCNDSSIYSTFASIQHPIKEEHSTFTTSSSSLSSSSSSYVSCFIQQPKDNISESKMSEIKRPDVLPTDEEKRYHELQQKLWHEDPMLCSKEQIATYLSHV